MGRDAVRSTPWWSPEMVIPALSSPEMTLVK
jgi:hypothetical protein